MPPVRKATTKHDVAIAEVQRKADRELTIARGVIAVFLVAASTLPILALASLVDPLAGRTTKVDVNLVVSIAVSISLALNGFQYLKGRSQRDELRRQRERMDELEAGTP